MAIETYGNGQGLLSSGIDNAVTSIPVGSRSPAFSGTKFRVLIDSEIVYVTADAAGTMTVARGQEGTTAAAHSSGAVATQIFTDAGLKNNPLAMTAFGDMPYLNSTLDQDRIAGNTTTTKKFLTQTGDGTNSAAPAWFDLFGTANTWSAGQSVLTTSTGQNVFESTATSTGISAVQTIMRGAQGGYGAGVGFQSKETGTNTRILQASIEAEGSGNWTSVATASSFLRFSTANAGTITEWMRLTATGKLLLGQTSAAAMLYLPAGTAAAFTAPLKFAAGTNLTTAEAGAMEYDGTNLFFTRAGTIRETVITASATTSETITSNQTLTINFNGVTYKLLAHT